MPSSWLTRARCGISPAATGQLAKTDTLDAQILPRFAAVIQPPARPLPDRETRELRDLVATRRHLVTTIAQQRTWRHRAGTQGQKLAQRHLTWLQAELAQVDRQLQVQRQAHPAWQQQDALLQSVPGVGPVLTSVLLAELPAPRGGPLTRVFPRRESVALSGSVGLSGVWLGQARRERLSPAVKGRKALWGRKCRCGGPRCAESRGGRGVESAMEECDEGPAPTARVGSGVAGIRAAQARAEIGAGCRSQPHAGPQIAAQQ